MEIRLLLLLAFGSCPKNSEVLQRFLQDLVGLIPTVGKIFVFVVLLQKDPQSSSESVVVVVVVVVESIETIVVVDGIVSFAKCRRSRIVVVEAIGSRTSSMAKFRRTQMGSNG